MGVQLDRAACVALKPFDIMRSGKSRAQFQCERALLESIGSSEGVYLGI